MTDTTEKKFSRFLQIMKRLRTECPWDKEQTPETLRRYILEEAYEVIESIDHNDWKSLSKELGDLLLQIIFQATIAQEDNHFSIDDVLLQINEKLIERHPHVFGNKQVRSAQEVENNWEHIKLKSENRDSLLSGVPKTAPSLLVAQRMQEKSARVGFDWPNTTGVLKKIREEITELNQAIQNSDEENIEEEVGDLLFSIVNLSRFLNISAEDALRKSNLKFQTRFQYIEKYFNHDFTKMKEASLTELDAIWEKAKEEKHES